MVVIGVPSVPQLLCGEEREQALGTSASTGRLSVPAEKKKQNYTARPKLALLQRSKF